MVLILQSVNLEHRDLWINTHLVLRGREMGGVTEPRVSHLL